MNKKRPRQIIFRASENEWEIIKKQIAKSGKKQQEYLLEMAMNKDIICFDELKKVNAELSRQGNNLNQVAKKLNQNKEIDAEILENAIKEWCETWQQLKQSLAELV